MGLDLFFTKKKSSQIGYFRKVNFLVKYFEDTRGLDVERQTPLRVYRKDIEELKNRCEEVLNDHSKAEELLPTVEGFLFGSTDYNKYYFRDVQEVYDYCLYLLNVFKNLQSNESIWFEIWY